MEEEEGFWRRESESRTFSPRKGFIFPCIFFPFFYSLSLTPFIYSAVCFLRGDFFPLNFFYPRIDS